MADIDEHGRPHPPAAAGEVETLLGFLEFQRATLAWKCRGVDAEGLHRRVAASAMSLGGLLKHMAYVEERWFSRALHDRDMGPPYDVLDWRTDRAWEWNSAAGDSPEELFALWERAVQRARDDAAAALADGGLVRLALRPATDGRIYSLRWILCHMIEEYARHNGHADLLREAVDGETGD